MMELLLAQVALTAGIIDAGLYSALVVMTLVTTLTTPPLLKRLMRRFPAEDVPTPVLPSPGRTVRTRVEDAPRAEFVER